MKFICIALFTASTFAFADDSLDEAERLYEAGDKQAAKAIYQDAADKGSAEAHFQLAYRYVVTSTQAIHHYSEAAERGHEKALGYALEELLFRAGSLKSSNPKRAWKVYS